MVSRSRRSGDSGGKMSRKPYGSNLSLTADTVETPGPLPTPCMVWRWARGKNGYGTISCKGKPKYAHRASYEAFRGPIPEGFQIDHLCKVVGCVNPEHLEAVTPRENTLRSNSLSAINARKTHCPRGHAYDVSNTCMNDGARRCRVCTLEQNRRSYWKFRDARTAYMRQRYAASRNAGE